MCGEPARTSPFGIVIRGPWPSLAPYSRAPVWQDLVLTAQRHPSKTALIQGDGTACTFLDLWKAAQGFARFLQREGGIAKGDTIAITAEGSREFTAAMYGALLLGVRVTPLSPLFREEELAAQLTDSGATSAVASRRTRRTIAEAEATGEVEGVNTIYPLEDVWAIAEAYPQPPEKAAIEPESDCAVLWYTSGTSGLPKGALLSHANLSASVGQRAAVGSLCQDSVLLDLLPVWHSIRLTIALGATCVEATGLDPGDTLRLIEQHRVTDIVVRPYYLRALLEAQERRACDVSNLRWIESSGTALAPATGRMAAERFGCHVRQAYHLTETCGSANRISPDANTLESVGWPVPDTEERIVDPSSGEDVLAGHEGELLVRGPQVMMGYWRRSDATTQALDAAGWLRTGDIARQDIEGRVSIVDRAKELIKAYGRQVAPAEIEAILLEHPAVQEAAVVPIPSAEAGELPKAFVVLRQGNRATAEELMASVALRLASYKCLEDLDFVVTLPRGPGGKILRRVLAERERERSSGRLPAH